MAFKSSWTPEETARAEQLLKIHPPRVVGAMIGRSARQVSNKFYSNKESRPGASLTEKSTYVKIPCLQCRNDFMSPCKINIRRCKACKTKEDGCASVHSLNMGASRHGRAE